jgi:hypothetical protein
MFRRVTQLIQLLMAVSLCAMPPTAVACPASSDTPQPEMSCCGPDCPCPTGKICPTASTQTDDRAVDHAATEIANQAAAPVLYFPVAEWKWIPARSFALTNTEPRPPSLTSGSPPQARLRVWLI